ncbi:hypothetical protein BT96DRAFT_1054785 [Gymnopus androsaceus JB14]|uniref:Protein kinase domain-containing protein n=1 Tax=Gymnopus androsaceus JB14 TaxID=1447944 RepID=A0A6A4I6P8_9AGAR|nr:hypothetical protein BT96DRAFT_1054785 [Gymnopus androsaceus JB14]
MLQPNKISFGNPQLLDNQDVAPAEDRYFQRLLAREESVKALRGKHAHELENRWTTNLQSIGPNAFVHNEDGVVDAQRQALDVVLRLATLALFDLTEKQIEHLNTWKLLAATTSLEQDAKADIIIRMSTEKQIELWDKLLNGKCEPTWPLVQDLSSTAYMKCINSMECKNLLLGNSNAYLTLLSLIRLMECGEVTEFWEKTACESCSQFRNSHDAHQDHFEWDFPLDSSGPIGLAASSDLDDIDTEIIRVLHIISLPDTTPEVTGDETDKPKSRDPWARAVYPHVQKLWNIELRSSISEAGLQVSDLDEIHECWAQMRVRGSSQAIISPFDHAEAEGYIIRQASWIVNAWEDAKKRSERELTTTTTGPHDPDDGDHDSDDTHPPSDEESIGWWIWRNWGGASGGGAGSSGGTGSFGGGTGSGGTAQKRGRESTSDSTGNTDKRARQHQGNIQIRPEGLHLAFNCPGTHLGSSGFSHFTRISPSTISEPAENPLDLPARFSRTKTPSPSSRRPSFASISSGTPSSSSRSSDSRSVLSTPPTDFSATTSFTPFSLHSNPVSKDVQIASASSQTLGPNPSAFVDSQSDDESSSSNIVSKVGVILEEKISGSTGIIVWRGKLYLEGPLAEGQEPLPVVVKLADWETNSEAEEGTETTHGGTLRREAEIYELIALEGSKLIPPFRGTLPFYGVYSKIWAPLRLFSDSVVRTLGSPRLSTLSRKKGSRFFLTELVNLHAIGVEHGDVAGRNILEGTEDSEGPLIIDFEDSKLGHNCLGPDTFESKELGI